MSESTRASGPGLHPQVRYSGYECKYLLSEGQADRIRRQIEAFVEPDRHARGRPGNRYEVSSAYLDDASLRLYRETLDGLLDRYKLRVRAYTDTPSDPLYFEVKRRRDRRISKIRARVPRDAMAAVLSDPAGHSACAGPDETAHLASFSARVVALRALPRVLVRYEREAYVGRFDESVRVTFDRRLCARVTGMPSSFFGEGDWHSVEGQKVIFELKFNHSYPRWMSAVIQSLGLPRVSYSKYAHSVDVCRRTGVLNSFAG